MSDEHTPDQEQEEGKEQQPAIDELVELMSEELPEPEEWTQKQFELALLQYAGCLDLAQTLGSKLAKNEEWQDRLELLNDMLFLRDEIEEAGQHHGWSAFELASLNNENLFEIEELDDMFRLLASSQQKFKTFLVGEYGRFRDTLSPSADEWWWWLDA